MRALGLPNTKHFHEITKIEDAMTCTYLTTLLVTTPNCALMHTRVVAERLKREGRHEIFDQETMEELEDEEGNVYNRKTYDDLKKQGLI
jgi:splicing factor 3A subunit 3